MVLETAIGVALNHAIGTQALRYWLSQGAMPARLWIMVILLTMLLNHGAEEGPTIFQTQLKL